MVLLRSIYDSRIDWIDELCCFCLFVFLGLYFFFQFSVQLKLLRKYSYHSWRLMKSGNIIVPPHWFIQLNSFFLFNKKKNIYISTNGITFCRCVTVYFFRSLFPGTCCSLSSSFQGQIIFCEYNRPTMISLSDACICISWKSPKKKVEWLIYQHSVRSRKLMQDNWAHRESLAICAFRLYLRN